MLLCFLSVLETCIPYIATEYLPVYLALDHPGDKEILLSPFYRQRTETQGLRTCLCNFLPTPTDTIISLTVRLCSYHHSFASWYYGFTVVYLSVVL